MRVSALPEPWLRGDRARGPAEGAFFVGPFLCRPLRGAP